MAEMSALRRRIIEDMTVIAIAHSLPTIARMDRIVVLDKGPIAASELLERDGLCARLWRLQTGGRIVDTVEET